MSYFSQDGFDVAMEWGLEGFQELSPNVDALVIVDVLSFTTCVSVAIDRGANVVPFPWKDDRAAAHAAGLGAELAGARGSSARLTLSPASMAKAEPGSTIVLPSPNGSRLSCETSTASTFAGCLRNARAVAAAAGGPGRRVGVVAAGERWAVGDTLRPSVEDLLGAGAVVHYLGGRKSPEAEVAAAAFVALRHRLPEVLATCASGVELTARGFAEDVAYAAELNASAHAPVLRHGSYVRGTGSAQT